MKSPFFVHGKSLGGVSFWRPLSDVAASRKPQRCGKLDSRSRSRRAERWHLQSGGGGFTADDGDLGRW